MDIQKESGTVPLKLSSSKGLQRCIVRGMEMKLKKYDFYYSFYCNDKSCVSRNDGFLSYI